MKVVSLTQLWERKCVYPVDSIIEVPSNYLAGIYFGGEHHFLVLSIREDILF